MPIFRLGPDLSFPPVELAESGLLAVGGDLRPERLIRAYRSGVFPWYSEGEPILWHAPDPRFVLRGSKLHVPKSLRRALRRSAYRLTMDRAFAAVIDACAAIPRPGQDGTWITDEMRDAYVQLHDRGLAHSVEAWLDGQLVGGLYGVSLGAGYFGESMFSLAPDASKIGFVRLVEQLGRWGIDLIDCQVYTDHLERFGAIERPRGEYMQALAAALEVPTREGHWAFDDDLSGDGAEPPAVEVDSRQDGGNR